MKKKTGRGFRIILIFIAAVLTFSFAAGEEANIERIMQEITLQKANSRKDPYTLMYRIKVTEPGRISVLLRKPEGTIHLKRNEALFRIMIGDQRSYDAEKMTVNQKYVKKSAKFVHERGLVDYTVDNFELGNTNGEYIVYISSFYDRNAYKSTLIIRYPVTKAADAKPGMMKMMLKPVEIKSFSE